MSTRVTEQEYPKLRVAQSIVRGSLLGLCEVQPSHSLARYLMATPDNRAIAMCTQCKREAEARAGV